MQLQIEYNNAPHQWQICCLCDHAFAGKQARVLACTEQGAMYGEVCPRCIGKGFDWMQTRFELLNQPLLAVRRSSKPQPAVALRR